MHRNNRTQHYRRLVAVGRDSVTAIGRQIIVLANRAPISHRRDANAGHRITRTASGLVTALEPLLNTHGGTWVAGASGPDDLAAADASGGVNVGGGSTPAYRLRYVALPEREHRGHYYGFSNEGLWPLCHDAGVEPVFRARDFAMYDAANARFADAVSDEAAGASPIVLVQDYHFALAPRALRRRLPSAAVIAFWHIPWPRAEVLHRCPYAHRLLDGLLGSDVVGVQTEDDRLNFLSGAERLHRSHVDLMRSTIVYRGRETRVRTYPVGVNWHHDAIRATPDPAACREAVMRRLALPQDAQIGVGVDRLDYTKGLNTKFLAIERLLERHREANRRFVFIQVAEPSRDALPAYQRARREIVSTADRINRRFAAGGYRPIHLLERHHEPAEVYQLYRAADLCAVNSLQDGMNLVAKEFAAARDDEHGVLILSEFAGAARQLSSALRVDPRRIDLLAAAFAQALAMPAVEQVMRMRLLRASVRTFDASWWAAQLLTDALDADDGAAASYDQPIRRMAS